MTKNRTPTPVYLDPGMHPGLEVKGLITPIKPIKNEYLLTLGREGLNEDILNYSNYSNY